MPCRTELAALTACAPSLRRSTSSVVRVKRGSPRAAPSLDHPRAGASRGTPRWAGGRARIASRKIDATAVGAAFVRFVRALGCPGLQRVVTAGGGGDDPGGGALSKKRSRPLGAAMGRPAELDPPVDLLPVRLARRAELVARARVHPVRGTREERKHRVARRSVRVRHRELALRRVEVLRERRHQCLEPRQP